MLKIKVCGLTDPVNVGEIATLAPDFMGFIFYPGSKRYIGKRPPDSLFNKIPSAIMKTGVFVNQEPSGIIEAMTLYRLDIIQLHGDESAEYCNSLKDRG